MSDENKGWQRLQQIAAKTVTSGGVNTAVTWEQHIAKCHLFTQRDALEVVAHVAVLAAQVESLRQQREDLQSEVERLKGENATMREAASRIWPMTWNDKPMHEWDQGDIANYVAGFWRHQHATARADALREVKAAVEKIEMAASMRTLGETFSEIFAFLDAALGRCCVVENGTDSASCEGA